MSMMWVGIGSTVVGAATSLYGANKSSKDQAGANAQNTAALREQDLNSWKAYLMQRGLDPSGVMSYGQIPTNSAPQNVRLPLWANMTFNKPQATVAGGAPASMVRRRTTARV